MLDLLCVAASLSDGDACNFYTNLTQAAATLKPLKDYYLGIRNA